ncbi:hypothetical protein [Antarctobacter sp.]|nr:hypothetical protein [Antarctobacter sp.]
MTPQTISDLLALVDFTLTRGTMPIRRWRWRWRSRRWIYVQMIPR